MCGQIVGDHVAVESPVITQDGFQQGLALAGPLTIDAVVAAHHHAHVGLGHGGLERRQVDLTQGTVIDHGIHEQAVTDHRDPKRQLRTNRRVEANPFLIVGHIVLNRGDKPRALRAANPPHADARRQFWVLTVAFKRSPVMRHPHDVDGGREHDVVALELGLRGHGGAVALSNIRVPGRCQRDGRGKRCALPAAHAHGAIAVVNRRDTQTLDAVARPGVRALESSDAREVVTGQEGDFLVRGHRINHQRRPLCRAQAGVAPGMLTAAILRNRRVVSAVPGRGHPFRWQRTVPARAEHECAEYGEDETVMTSQHLSLPTPDQTACLRKSSVRGRRRRRAHRAAPARPESGRPAPRWAWNPAHRPDR